MIAQGRLQYNPTFDFNLETYVLHLNATHRTVIPLSNIYVSLPPPDLYGLAGYNDSLAA